MSQMWTAPDAGPFERAFAVITLSAITIFGICLTAEACRYHALAEGSLHWPKADGTLLMARERVTYSRSGNIIASLLSAQRSVEVEYRYTVNKQSFSGTNPAYEKPVEVDEFAKTHSIGGSLAVYYNPKSKKDSVLYPGSEMPVFLLNLGIGLFILGAGFVLLNNAVCGWIAHDKSNHIPKQRKKKRRSGK